MLTNINEWNFNFESLPYWDNRNTHWNARDMLYENEQMDMAFVVYSIIETRMCFYEGFLAVLKNKQKPELLLNVTTGTFTERKVVFSSDGKFAFMQSALWDKGWPVFVFDLSTQQFACFKTVTTNLSFSVEEIDNSFIITADKWQMEHDSNSGLRALDGTEIETNKLKWFPFEEINSFCRGLHINQST